MIHKQESPWQEQIGGYLPPSLRAVWEKLCENHLDESIHELRLRVQRPFMVWDGAKQWLVQSRGTLTEQRHTGLYWVSEQEIQSIYHAACEYSVHSFMSQLTQGFLTVQGGHRIGFCANAVRQGTQVTAIKEVTSLHIRLARQKKGLASRLIQTLFVPKLTSVLIAGPPASGKTTLLRDLMRGLADGENGKYIKVAAIDERGELSAMWRGLPQYDVGLGTDLYYGFPKAQGMSIALRTASPQLLLCDELGNEDELEQVRQCMHSGVALVATAHGDSLQGLCQRKHIVPFLQTGCFEYVVFLQKLGIPERIERVSDFQREGL